MSMKITSHDVARAAGVSRTTVSMVLNGSHTVALSDETRERVKKAAADLGYRINSAGRMLASGATKTIALIVTNPELLLIDGFIPPTLFAISREAAAHGYNVLIEGLPPEGNERGYRDLVMARRIDGMIVLNPRSNDPQLASLIEQKFPVVLLGAIRDANAVSLSINDRDAIREAVAHLVQLGHRSIGHVALSQRGTYATDHRIETLRAALEECGLELPDAHVAYANFDAQSGRVAAHGLLELQPSLTAIIAGNDTVALGVMRAARERGMALPRDLSIIGYDDLPFATFLEPPLTTIRTAPVEQGIAATQLLIRMITDHEGQDSLAELRARFIGRNSCAPPRA
jgi:DNA-binding LacI/PurR family transcriptional regulator